MYFFSLQNKHVRRNTPSLLENIFEIVSSKINILSSLAYLLYPVTFIIFAMSELSKVILNQNDTQKNSTTTLRKGISPNWQSFLQTQTQTKKIDEKSKIKREINGYYKLIKAEKQNAKKANMEKKVSSNKNIISNVKNKDGSPVLTRYVAMDCEMVGVGERGLDNMLARVSIVNKFGDCIYDKFVKPREAVVDYRTPVSGVRREDLLNAEPFDAIQKEVAEILKGRYLVGHALRNDLDVLFLSHPYSKIRDTSKYKPFRMVNKYLAFIHFVFFYFNILNLNLI